MALICSLHQPELARRYFDRTLAITNGSLVCEPELRAREASRRSA
jgi:ABC-type phosphate/phosphonate transport system ATPase subunit